MVGLISGCAGLSHDKGKTEETVTFKPVVAERVIVVDKSISKKINDLDSFFLIKVLTRDIKSTMSDRTQPVLSWGSNPVKTVTTAFSDGITAEWKWDYGMNYEHLRAPFRIKVEESSSDFKLSITCPSSFSRKRLNLSLAGSPAINLERYKELLNEACKSSSIKLSMVPHFGEFDTDISPDAVKANIKFHGGFSSSFSLPLKPELLLEGTSEPVPSGFNIRESKFFSLKDEDGRSHTIALIVKPMPSGSRVQYLIAYDYVVNEEKTIQNNLDQVDYIKSQIISASKRK